MQFSRDLTEFGPLQLDSEVSIPATYATRNLGVIFDSKLSFRSHVSNVGKPTVHQLKKIQSVKSYIPKFMLETLVAWIYYQSG